MDPTKTPAMHPPPGVSPDFNAPDPLHAVNVFSIIFCLSLCTILLAIQLCTKKLLMHGLLLEDYVTILGWVIFVPYCGLGLQLIYGNRGNKHQWDVSIAQMAGFANIANIVCIIYVLLMLMIKSAVLLQYLRIFVPQRNRSFYLAWILIAINIVFNIGLALTLAFQCVPRRKIWAPWLPGRCINVGATLMISAVSNTVTDFATLLLPMYTIWNLQLPLKRKLGISAVFTIGLFGCAASLVRLVFAFELIRSEDMTYLLAIEYHWALAEITSGMVCCCLTCFPKLCRHLAGQAKRSLARITDPSSTPSPQHSGERAKVLAVQHRQDPYMELDDLKTSSTGSSGREQWWMKKYESEVEHGV
ncbi:MAG: hypothetical protein L6R36_003244 [Xanthoria steineri]|nr:MAG: hypothetical protein L6R36_003244 [Xanthoria steineri]